MPTLAESPRPGFFAVCRA